MDSPETPALPNLNAEIPAIGIYDAAEWLRNLFK